MFYIVFSVVSLVVIMFKLTGGINYIIPIMVTVMVSKWVADIFIKDGMHHCAIYINVYCKTWSILVSAGQNFQGGTGHVCK